MENYHYIEVYYGTNNYSNKLYIDFDYSLKHLDYFIDIIFDKIICKSVEDKFLLKYHVSKVFLCRKINYKNNGDGSYKLLYTSADRLSDILESEFSFSDVHKFFINLNREQINKIKSKCSFLKNNNKIVKNVWDGTLNGNFNINNLSDFIDKILYFINVIEKEYVEHRIEKLNNENKKRSNISIIISVLTLVVAIISCLGIKF